MIKLRSYQLAVEFYRDCKVIRLPGPLQDQLKRASSSIALNLAEGYGKRSRKDRERFFSIAFGSIRECQSIADLEPEQFRSLNGKLDHLAASVYRLIHG